MRVEVQHQSFLTWALCQLYVCGERASETHSTRGWLWQKPIFLCQLNEDVHLKIILHYVIFW